MTWEEQGCGVCKEVAVCGYTVVRGQTPTLPKHTKNLSPCMGPSIPAVTGEEGNAALWLLPPFQQRDSQAASRLAASREGIRTINTDSIHFPAAVTAAGWVVGGTGTSALLPGVSLQLAENCPRGGTAPVKSEEDVNLLTIFAVCVSRQMKLINRGRSVTLSKVLTSKSKYLHRCAGSCQLLGIAVFLDQFMPPTAPALFLHCSAPAALWEASSPGRGQGLRHRGRREALSQDAQETGCWAPGLFALEGCLLQPSCLRASFFPSSRMSF